MNDQQQPRTDGTGEGRPDWTAPTWYTPHGGTTTATQPVASDATSAHHPQTGPTGPAASPPPPSGPPAPVGPSGSPGPSSRPGTRRIAELSAVAVLAALLSTGGTLAAVRLADDTPASTGSSASEPDRGTDTAPVSQADASNPDWAATADAVSPSVVAITARTPNGQGAGSGVIVDDAAHVVTNNHVVAGAEQLQVTLDDGRTFAAEIQGTDPSTDLAVITIQDAPDDLTPVSMGDSDALTVGDPVMAVGNPLGLAGTVTTGIVSALNRPVTTASQEEGQQSPFGQQQSASEPVVTNAIQTSAAINPGNSGGALVDASGRLVGINSSIASLGASGGGQAGSIGIGFAIPVTEVQNITEQLIESGTAQHAFLGVRLQDGSASDGSATRAGAEIVSVEPNTPAAEAGLQEGDVVVAVDGDPVDGADSLVGHVREQAIGSSVTLTVLRDGASTELPATLSEQAATTG
ncbi:trypsin-like peptidase domain-containing protein [Phycicoccus sp. BSK3Z-2]|uniref:Trypsin-like peptidase domain-containing protein n=1 Tax=Phycicoccus avicenniae TaxID=2828860 RepID=A0A941HYM1_9MICO|nr:trypsin-like peptidase domain-containing protein [Phycicoccus avicenniae]MBR7741982.1 trypsin-like peptidase domain-containing protein [Phycicoccus avicenniae]